MDYFNATNSEYCISVRDHMSWVQFLEALCEPRDAALRGVRVEKKQVNSVSRFQCERLASLYFTYLTGALLGSGAISCPLTG